MSNQKDEKDIFTKKEMDQIMNQQRAQQESLTKLQITEATLRVHVLEQQFISLQLDNLAKLQHLRDKMNPESESKALLNALDTMIATLYPERKEKKEDSK